MKNIKRLFITLFISVLIGFCLMCIAFVIPTKSIEKNVKRSVPILNAEKNYITPIRYFSTYDNFTEAIYLNEAMVSGKENGVVKSALSGYSYYGSRVENLNKAVNDPNRKTKIGAGSKRFWNGYILPVKIALTITDYSRIRQINFIIQIFLFQWLLYLLVRKKLAFLVIPFVLSYVFLDPFALGNCLTYAGFYYCTIVPCIVMLLFNEKFKEREWYGMFFCVVGSCVIYFNMNYFQLITFGVPMILFFALNRESSVRQMIRTFLTNFICWLFGYVGMMVSKWILYAIFVDGHILMEMFNNIVFRVGTTIGEKEITRIGAILKNFKGGLKYGRIWLLGEVIYLLYCCKGNISQGLKKLKLGLSVAKIEVYLVLIFFLMVICRYVIFANHVYIHTFVTYRLLVLPILAFNVLVAMLVESEGKADGE